MKGQLITVTLLIQLACNAQLFGQVQYEPGLYEGAKKEKYGTGKRSLLEVRSNGLMFIYESTWSDDGNSKTKKLSGRFDQRSGNCSYVESGQLIQGRMARISATTLSVGFSNKSEEQFRKVDLNELRRSAKFVRSKLYRYDEGQEARYPAFMDPWADPFIAATSTHVCYVARHAAYVFDLKTQMYMPYYFDSTVTDMVSCDNRFWFAVGSTLTSLNPVDGRLVHYKVSEIVGESGMIECLASDVVSRSIWVSIENISKPIWKYGVLRDLWSNVAVPRGLSPGFIVADDEALLVHCSDVIVVIEHGGAVHQVKHEGGNGWSRAVRQNSAHAGNVHYFQGERNLLAIDTKTGEVTRGTIEQPGNIIKNLIASFPWVTGRAYWSEGFYEQLLYELVDKKLVKEGAYGGDLYRTMENPEVIKLRGGRSLFLDISDKHYGVHVLADFGENVLVSPDSGVIVINKKSHAMYRLRTKGKYLGLYWYRGELCAIVDETWSERYYEYDTEPEDDYCDYAPIRELFARGAIATRRALKKDMYDARLHGHDAGDDVFINKNDELVIMKK